MAKEKKVTLRSFDQGVNTDSANTGRKAIENGWVRFMLNCRIYGTGAKGIIKNIMGNLNVPFSLPDGENYCLGWGKNEETGKLYFFNYNDGGFHGIYVYDIITKSVTPVLQNLTDTNNTDILNFSKDWLINHVDIVSDKLLYWVDGLNKARKTNILKCIDKTSSGYGTVVNEDFITAYKQTGVYAPTVSYFTDLSRTSNYLYALQFKFCYRFYYDDGEISNCSDFSGVALPPNESYLGQDAITFDNNGINVIVPTGNRLVVKIEILVKINDLDFVSCIVLNKSQLKISDYATYTWAFYNDGAYIPVDNVKVQRPYSFLPRIPYGQAFVKVAMTYENAEEGFSTVAISGSVAVSFVPFYLPAGTVSMLNNPLFTVSLTSSTEHGGLFNGWFTTVSHFEIGGDVKKGNIFTISSFGGQVVPLGVTLPPKTWQYIATVSDTAQTVASHFKDWMRGISAVGIGVVSNESTGGDGSVQWDFTIEAHEGANAITFSTGVTPVNYSTLLDNGFSINTIKQGASRKYAIVYDDDDGRTSLAYTADSLLVRTPFETETVLGQSAPIGLQQPIHTITITNQPPVWAKYWRLVRTSDTATFIQLLIQQVNKVVVANEDTYLDLLVGSLFTYQIIHPDTILQYEFKRGDRLRLISNDSALPDGPPVPYTPFFETEVLDYLPVVDQFINSNITVAFPAVNTVTTTATVDDGDLGKYIIINNVQRLITGVDTGTGTYTLDEPISPNVTFQSQTPVTTAYPSYTLKDIRGTLRIKIPPSSYTVVNQSLVEIYRPQSNIDNSSYLNFNDFQQKYPVNNWGTPQAAHAGNIQNQDGLNPVITPCIVQVTQGDAYVRNRAMPSNNQNPNPQVIIDQICDPNFSDFYQSNLYSTGRVYPQDQAYGVVKFDQRVRFSNNYIQDTQVNGLNDFDNTDREDYNDAYGAINLARFRNGVLYLYKALKNTWTPVLQSIIVDNSGQEQLATSDKLLNQLQYSAYDGGIGNNGESWFEFGDYFYMAFAAKGVFMRTAQDGTIPISEIFLYDKRAREVLSSVSSQNLRIFGGFDEDNNDAIWTVPSFIEFIFNNAFNAGDWQTVLNAYPDGTIWVITQQPANSTATVVGNQIQITGTNTLGNDFFKFQGNMPGGGTTPVINFCFTVIQSPNRPTSFKVRESSAYCEQTDNPTPPPLTSTLNVNDLSTDTIITRASLLIGSTVQYNEPNVLPGQFRTDTIFKGTYSVFVKVASSPGSNNSVLTISSAGTPTTYAIGPLGRTVNQDGVVAPVIIQLDNP